MKLTLRQIFGMTIALSLLTVLVAGCGGGGGSSSTALSTTKYGNMSAKVMFRDSVPHKMAASVPTDVELFEDSYLYQDCGSFTDWMTDAEATTSSDEYVPVYLYVTEMAESLYNTMYVYSDPLYPEYSMDGPIASACTEVYRDTSTGRITMRTTGEFEIRNVYAGINHLLEAKAFTGSGSGVYLAAIVPYVDEGMYTYDIILSPESTLVAAAALQYASQQETTIDMVSYEMIYALETVVYELFPEGFSYGTAITPESDDGLSSVTFTDYSSFSSQYATGTTTWAEYVINEAELVDLEDPYVLFTDPMDGATGVAYDGTAFSVVFSETMDTTATLDSFSLTLQSGNTMGSVTIDQSNYSSYGTLSWSTTYETDDTLTFTLNSNTTLEAAGLKQLRPGTTYSVTTYTLPTTLTDLVGNPVDTTYIMTPTGFTTTGDSAAPTVSSYSPTDGATGVAYDGTSFSVVFDQSMIASMDFTAYYFEITLENDSTMGLLTIDETNYDAYGTFSWGTTTNTNDTLTYTLKSNSVLTGAGLKTLDPNTSYTIMMWSPPSYGLLGENGLAPDVTSMPTSGSFTTAP